MRIRNLMVTITGLFICIQNIAQVYEPGKLYVRIKTSNAVPVISDTGINKRISFTSTLLDTIFSSHNLQDFSRAFIQTQNENLNNTYEVTCYCDEEQLMNHLLFAANDYYSIVERIPVIIPTYTPNDFSTFGTRTDLDLIKAAEAWDITKGDSNITIAIIECCNGFDITHEDLQSQIVYVEPGIDINSSNFHGNAVAGCAAAATDNVLGISGIGFDCKLMLYTGGYNDILDAANRGAKIINCSWGSIGTAPPTTWHSVIETVYNMGVTVVAGAGNGICWERKFCLPGSPNDCDSCTTPMVCDGGFIGDGICKVYPASYDHVISVTSVGHISEIGYVDSIYGANNWKDVVEEIPGNKFTVHNTNDKVDICAPGFNVLSTITDNKYGGSWGTSFSGPMIAGICGLILSVKSCLQPDEVEAILKNTAHKIDTIFENQQYAGKLGVGRVNAFEAVKFARDYFTLVNLNESWDVNRSFGGDVLVTNGANLKITQSTTSLICRNELIVNDSSTLTLQIGGKLEISEKAKVIIKKGGKLVLETGAEIILQDSACIVVDSLATLLLNGNNITLAGNSATIVVKPGGAIRTADGVDFTFSGDGYVQFHKDSKLDLGSGSRVWFTGRGKDHRHFVFHQGAQINVPKREVYIDKAKLTFAANASFGSSGASAKLVSATFESTGATGSTGYLGDSLTQLFVLNCAFNSLDKGISLSNTDSIADNIALSIYRSNFTGNNTAITAASLKRQLLLQECTLDGQGSGLYGL